VVGYQKAENQEYLIDLRIRSGRNSQSGLLLCKEYAVRYLKFHGLFCIQDLILVSVEPVSEDKAIQSIELKNPESAREQRLR
jgi:hypothetical protein